MSGFCANRIAEHSTSTQRNLDGETSKDSRRDRRHQHDGASKGRPDAAQESVCVTHTESTQAGRVAEFVEGVDAFQRPTTIKATTYRRKSESIFFKFYSHF